MRFNDSQSLSPWPVSEAMADIVTTSLRIGAKTDGAMDITVGPLVNLWGFGPEQQPVQIPSQEQIDAMKAKTGLQHLTVINQSHQQYLQKPAGFICRSLYRRRRLCGGSSGTLDGAGRDFPLSGVGGRRAEQPWYER